MTQDATEQSARRAVVLAVDDTEANLDLLVDILGDDYDVMAASDGPSALETAAEFVPDLILLDIMMPGMDGYEVCRRLKAEATTRCIPIIFTTALGEVEDEANGLDMGAVDYLIKPLKPAIVRARVKTHLALLEAMRDLAHQNEILRENTALREDVEHITRHDLKAPLAGVIGLPQILALESNITPEQRKLLCMIEQNGWRLLRMINLSLDIYKMEKGTYQFRPETLNLVKILRTVFDDLKHNEYLSRNELQLTINGVEADSEAEVLILGEELLCYTLFANLIANALEASEREGVVSIDIIPGAQTSVAIHNATEVHETMQHRFFVKYATFGKKTGTGLGTYSAKLIVDQHGGSIAMDTAPQAGTTVTVALPAPATAS